jgi:hypothetical protein
MWLAAPYKAKPRSTITNRNHHHHGNGIRIGVVFTISNQFFIGNCNSLTLLLSKREA